MNTEILQYFIPDCAEHELDSCLKLLSQAERIKIEQLRQQPDKKRFILARGYLRLVLASRLDMPAESLQFAQSKLGKLHLSDQFTNNVYFNVSHSGDWIVLAVDSSGEVGVDVECMQRDLNCLELAERFFHPQEYAALLALPDKLQRQSFFYTWVCKEAVLKCDGRGISYGLDSFIVNVDPRQPAAVISAASDLCSGLSIKLKVWQPSPTYYSALAYF